MWNCGHLCGISRELALLKCIINASLRCVDTFCWHLTWKNNGEWTGEVEIRTRHWLSILGYILTYSVLLRENICQLCFSNRGDLNISAYAVPSNKDRFQTKRKAKMQHTKLLKQNNSWKWPFCHNKWVAKRLGYRNMEFHIVSALIKTSTTDTNSNSSLADNLNCVLWKVPRNYHVVKSGGGGRGGIGWL